MSQRPALSVIMPVYNGEAHLDEALGSVIGQTFPDFEVVAVDDGSTDGSWDVLEAWADRDTRIHPHRLAANRGHDIASNTAIARARGRIIARLDQDDLAMPRRFERTVQAFTTHPDVGLVYSSYLRLHANGRRQLRTPPLSETSLRIAQLFGNSVCHSSLAFRADVLAALDVGYRPLPGPQDYDLVARLLEQTRSHGIEEPLAIYRHEAMAMTGKYASRMEAAVSAISARQLQGVLPVERVPAARRVFQLQAVDGDVAAIADVRSVFACIAQHDPFVSPEEARRVAQDWTGRALAASLASGGGLPRSARFLATLTRGDVGGAARWVGHELTKRVRRRRLPSTPHEQRGGRPSQDASTASAPRREQPGRDRRP